MNHFERYLGDTFELVDVIKSAEQGFVAIVYDKKIQRVCTMKERSLNSLEIYKTLKEINNPNIPEIYRTFERDGKLIVVEEYIDGQTLEEILIYQMPAFDEKFAPEILKQICNCLAVVHKSDIVHRDIKPSNIMLTKGNVVKLIDFGQTDARSDIYSLGITVKQLLGENYHGWLLKILNRCTALEPNQRYQSVSEIFNAIDNTRKFQIVKKIFTVGGIFIAVLAFPKTISDIQPIEVNPVKPVTPVEESAPVPVNKPKPNNQPTNFPQIILVPSNVQPIEPPTVVNPKPSPTPVLPEKNPVKPRESVDGVDLYFYVNGSLTGTNGSHLVEINGWQNWNSYSNGVLFPNGWNSRLHVENNSAEDLINPLITIKIGQEEYSVQKSTVKAGQSIDINIPLANKFAAPIKGVGNLQIILQMQGRSPIYLNRTFKLVE